MAKKDDLDTDVRKPGKPAKPASGKGSLLTVITLLWLAGLTAFVFMMLKKPQDSGLENRVAKLESKAATVGGKIKKPGTENVESEKGGSSGTDAAQIAGLEQRLAQLEQKLGEVSPAGVKDGTSAAGISAAPVPGAATYDEIKSKVDELEARLMACDACTEKPVAKAVVPEKKTEPKKAVARAKKKARPRVTTASKSSPVYKAPVAAAPNAVKAPQMGNYEHYDTVYDISMRVGPMYGHTDRDSIDYSRMAPGAAVHPASNPAPGDSFAGTSTYYNKGLFE